MSGITQLVALGQADAHLYDKPEMSWFRSAYKRVTPSSHVTEASVLQGVPRNGGMSSVRFERKGDLLSSVYLTRTDNSNDSATIIDWSKVVSSVELYIGGSLIDTHDYEFSTKIYSQLMAPTSSRSDFGSQAGAGANHINNPNESFFYPLKFFFAENVSQSLPLCALPFMDVEVRIYWADGADDPFAGHTMNVFSKYIFLADDERNYFTNNKIDMLIHQTQKIATPNSSRIELNFNHPVKFIASTASCFDEFNKVKFQVNGTDIGDARTAVPHFRQVSSYYYGIHGINQSASYNATDEVMEYRKNFYDGFSDVTFVMPFCEKIEQVGPTGTLNFSRIDSSRIEVVPNAASSNTVIDAAVYAVNYNVLTLENGMAGMRYSS